MDAFLAEPKLAFTVKTITSGLITFASLAATGVCVPVAGAVCLATSRCVSMLRLLNKPFENSRL